MPQPTKTITAYIGQMHVNTTTGQPYDRPAEIKQITLDVSSGTAFIESVKKYTKGTEKPGLYFLFEEYNGGKVSRGAANVTAKTAAVLDVEKEGTPTWNNLELREYLYGGYSTYNHEFTDDNHDGGPRWRVIIPFESPLDVTTPDGVAKYEAVYMALADLIGGGKADTGGKQLAKAMYTPRETGANGKEPEYVYATGGMTFDGRDDGTPRPLTAEDIETLAEKGRQLLIKEQPQTPTLTETLAEAGGADGDALTPEPRVNLEKKQTKKDKKAEAWEQFLNNDPCKERAYTRRNLELILKYLHPGIDLAAFSCIFPGHADINTPSMHIHKSGTHVYCFGNCTGNPYKEKGDKRTADIFDVVRLAKKCKTVWESRRMTYRILDEIGGDGAGTLESEFKTYSKEHGPGKETKEPTYVAEVAEIVDALEVTKSGKVKNEYGNIRTIMMDDERYSLIKFNLFSYSIDFDGKLPWDHKMATQNIDKYFWAMLKDDLYIRYGFKPNSEDLKDAFIKAAMTREYHPIQEYLESLKWDGVPRVETLLTDVFGTEDSPLNRAVIRKTLSAAVQRVYEPGIKFDSVCVLIGPQGIGKSLFWSRLGGKWFSDNVSFYDMKDKTACEKMKKNWILEVSELQGRRKGDTKRIKAFLTTQIDEYRPTWGEDTIRVPRQNVFVGTTNEETFLNDVTGDRRWWVVETPEKTPTAEMWTNPKWADQVWAEVMEKYRDEKLILPDWLEAQMRERQKEKITYDENTPAIMAYLDNCLKTGKFAVTGREIIINGLGMRPEDVTRMGHDIRLAVARIGGGWEYKQYRFEKLDKATGEIVKEKSPKYGYVYTGERLTDPTKADAEATKE